MRTKIIFTCFLILVLHVTALLPSCNLFTACGDPSIIEATVDHVILVPYSWNRIENTGVQREFPLDGKNLRLSISLSASDTINLYAELPSAFFINSAYADDCAPPYLKLTEHIVGIEIWQLSDLLVDLSDYFLVENFNNDLYEEVDSYLKQADRNELNLVYRDSLLIDDVTLVVKTQLSDLRVFTDTITIELR